MNIVSDLERTKDLTKVLMDLNTTVLIPTGYGVDEDCYTAIMFVRERHKQISAVVQEIDNLQRGK
jgi:hypothetical protein